MRKLRAAGVALCAVVFMPGVVALGQAEPHHTGQTIELANNLKLRVISVGVDAFPRTNVTGVAKVFELQFLRADDGPIVALEPSTDSANSGIKLIMGESPVAPKALAYSANKSSELDVVAVGDLARRRDTGRGFWVSFSHQSTKVQWLFDVPKEIADKPAKLVLDILVDFKQPPISVGIVQ